MVCRILIFVALFISSSQSSLLAQCSYEELFKASRAIVVGKAEKTLLVIDSKKMSEANEDLQKVEESVLGRLTFFKVEEIIYAEKKTKIDRTVLVYVPKGYWADNSFPRFKNDERYLLFLTTLQVETNFENAVISNLDGNGETSKFDSQTAFAPTKNNHGVIQLTESNEVILNQIRKLVILQNE